MDICFWIRRGDGINKAGKVSVYCTVTVNGVAATGFSTGCRVLAHNWDVKKKTTKDEFQDVVRQELGEVEKKLRRIKLELEDSSDIITAHLVRATYLDLRAKGIKPEKIVKEIKFFELMRNYMKDKQALGAACKTQQNNLVIYTTFWNFIKTTGSVDIRMKDIDLDLMDRFSFYMRTVKKVSINHTNTHISLIRKVLDIAVLRKLIVVNGIAAIELKYSEKFDAEGLTVEDIELLEGVEAKTNFEKSCIDIFLFLCGSGIDYCDYVKLKDDNLREKNGRYMLRHERQKTDTYTTDTLSVANPILKPCAVRILEKYGSIEAMPIVKNIQNVNRTIQVVGERLGIKVHLTTKRGRKTFSNLSINKEKHTDEQTAYQLGHATTKMLKHYRRYNDSILDDLF